MFAEPSFTMGGRRDLDQRGLARFLPVCHNVHTNLYLSVMIAPFLEHVLYLSSFKQFEGRAKVLPESFP